MHSTSDFAIAKGLACDEDPQYTNEKSASSDTESAKSGTALVPLLALHSEPASTVDITTAVSRGFFQSIAPGTVLARRTELGCGCLQSRSVSTSPTTSASVISFSQSSMAIRVSRAPVVRRVQPRRRRRRARPLCPIRLGRAVVDVARAQGALLSSGGRRNAVRRLRLVRTTSLARTSPQRHLVLRGMWAGLVDRVVISRDRTIALIGALLLP
jgi:hypothetical protein